MVSTTVTNSGLCWLNLPCNLVVCVFLLIDISASLATKYRADIVFGTILLVGQVPVWYKSNDNISVSVLDLKKLLLNDYEMYYL